MNLQELGAVFKQERERRGLSVEDVVQRTKISRRNLLAIEAGRKEDLPHPVYAKGFVKNYARLLDLDPEEYAAALAQEYFVADDDFGNDPTRDKPISMTAARNVGQGRRTSLRGLLVLLLVAAVAGAVLWATLFAPKQPTAPQPPVPQAAPAAPAEPEPAPAPQDQATEAQPQAGEGEPVVPPSEEPAPAAEPAPAPAAAAAAEPAKPAPKPAAEPQAAAPKLAPKPEAKPEPKPEAKPAAEVAPAAPAQATPAPVAVATGTRIMEIKASQLCWVNAEVDGSIVLDMLLQPGEAKAIHFDKALTVKFGNAGGVKVTLDNKPFPLNAQSGEVRTVTIP